MDKSRLEQLENIRNELIASKSKLISLFEPRNKKEPILNYEYRYYQLAESDINGALQQIKNILEHQ